MEKLIDEYIEKIRMQIIDIKNLSSEDKFFRLEDYVKSILDLISELSKLLNDDNDKRMYETLWNNLDYTLGREVEIAKSAYYKARKKNARLIRESEYHKMLHAAIKQVEFELSYFRN